MLQALLRDRFRLVVRRETKELPIYELVTGKGGPKLKEPREGSNSGIWTEQPGEFHGGKASTAAIATFLSEVMDRYVVDRTGIEGVFDFTLTWPPHTIADRSPDANGSSIFTAIQEQLGLKLVSAKGPVEILIIDHVERPSEN